jgi:hypothetical protein
MGTDRERGENALVPAHTGKGVDRLLDTRLRLLTIKESLELFLQWRANKMRKELSIRNPPS